MKANFTDDKALVKQALHNSSHSSIEAPKQISLTELERDVLECGIANNQYAEDVGDAVWSESIAGHCKTTTPAQLSGVISSLVQKGLVQVSQGDGSENVTNITDEGVKFFESEYRDGGWHLKREGSEKNPATLEERLQELIDEKSREGLHSRVQNESDKRRYEKRGSRYVGCKLLAVGRRRLLECLWRNSRRR